jgi:hypothetical protein
LLVRNLAIALAGLAACAAHAGAAAELVANRPANAAEITRPFLRGMFGMRLRAWPDGTPVHVFVLGDDHPVHAEFCTEVLQMYPYQLRQGWDRLVYSGTGQPPIQLGSEEELLRRVAETPGAVGYIEQRQAQSLPAQVQVLHVR